jgi:hypothetical protein
MNRRTVAFVVVGLLVLAAFVGLGVAAYNQGIAQGVAQTQSVEGTAPALAPWQGHYGWYGGPWHGAWFGGGFLFFGLLKFLLFAAILLFLARWLLWGGRHGRGPDGGPESRQQRFDDWHRRAHDESQGGAPQTG